MRIINSNLLNMRNIHRQGIVIGQPASKGGEIQMKKADVNRQ